MKIAIPTNDGIHLSAHFGRSQQFLIFEAAGEHVNLIEKRENPGCHGHHDATSGAGQTSHAGFLEVLRDCGAVLCGGIGAGALDALKAGGIQVVLVASTSSAQELAANFHSGTIQPSTDGLCRCHH